MNASAAAGESIGSSKSKARFSDQERLLGCFGFFLLLAGFAQVEGSFKCAHATILSTHQIVYYFLHFIREVS